jgi:hypothetical protein
MLWSGSVIWPWTLLLDRALFLLNEKKWLEETVDRQQARLRPNKALELD